MDEKTKVEQLKKHVIKFRDERDWKQFHNPKDIAMGINIEASELLENFLWKNVNESNEALKTKKSEIEDELADIICYCMTFADVCDIDITEAVLKKIEKNCKKYPVSKCRGKAAKYTEL
ncbi:MAG: nucleotide pyrophosphohydrolase [Candidatus Muiribacteriota bacterium]